MSSLSLSEIVLRLLAATAAGALVGWERESHGRAAGLRTTILACVASAISMIVSELLFSESGSSGGGEGMWRPDPARLGAGILTGIGFLGAGTILRHANVIRGVTTAASLWFVTVIGLALGSGHYVVAAIGVAIALVTLLLLPPLEHYIPSDWYVNLTVTTGFNASEGEIRERLEQLGLRIKRTQFDLDIAGQQKTTIYELKLHRQTAMDLAEKTVAALQQQPGVLRVRWD